MKKWMHRYGEITAAAVSGLGIVAAAIVNNYWSSEVAVLLYLFAFIIGGFVKAVEGMKTLFVDKDLDVNLLMIFAAIGAASIGYWTEGALLIFIFALSGALETYTMNKSSRDISALAELKPETAVVMKEGKEQQARIEELQIGDIVIVKPGERLPADGVVCEGTSAVDQSSITGESIPVDKERGDEVFAGTLNGEGALFVEVTQSSESSLFAKIIKMVQEAQSEMPASQNFIEKFEGIYAKVIVLVTSAIIIIPPLLTWMSWGDAFYKAMVFMVVASPCALVASIMPAMLSAISTSARRGVLFKGGAHLEHLAKIKAIAFDKTGTLTAGKPKVTNIIVYGEWEEKDLLGKSALLESLSNHPLAKAIKDKAVEAGIAYDHAEMNDFQALTGWGLQAQISGRTWKIGKPQLLEQYAGENNGWLSNRDAVRADISRLEAEGKTVTVIFDETCHIGVIAMRDVVRQEAKDAIANLQQAGIKTVMLTGDQPKTAYAIAAELGIEREYVYAGLLPEDKAVRIAEMKEKFGTTAMVGDGVNDAPALAVATVGIAMGAAGSGAALETADLVLMNDDITKISDSIALGKRAITIIKQNIVFAIAVISVLIASNFISGISLPLGVIGHEGSTILVILNGLRLLFHRQEA